MIIHKTIYKSLTLQKNTIFFFLLLIPVKNLHDTF